MPCDSLTEAVENPGIKDVRVSRHLDLILTLEVLTTGPYPQSYLLEELRERQHERFMEALRGQVRRDR